MRLDRVALERDLAGDVAFRVLVVLALDVDAGPDNLDRADRVGRVIDRHPIDVLQRRQHFGAQFGVEDRSARTLVDEAVGGNGNDQHVAEPARRFEMAHMAEMQEIERAVRLHDGLAELAKLRRDLRYLFEGAHLVARSGRGSH